MFRSSGFLLCVTAVFLVPSAALAQSADTASAQQQVKKSAEELIFAVDRKPEPVFQTGRGVEVITSEEIRRRNVRTVSDLLQGRAGIFLYSPTAAKRSAEIRGMQSENVMIMVDGVRINNSTWGSSSKEYLDLIDISEIERVEIVRGAVAVLGTESTAGIINIITRKATAHAAEGIGGDLGLIVNSSDRSTTTPISVTGRSGRFRYAAGGTIAHAENLRAGKSAGLQTNSDYGSRAAHLGLQFTLTPDQTFSALFETTTHEGRKRPREMSTTHLYYGEQPVEMALGTIGYNDLTGRPFADTIHVNVFWNQQRDGREEIRRSSPTSERFSRDRNTSVGFGSELTKFIGSHQFVYGLDYSHDQISSTRSTVDLVTSLATPGLGRFMDGARYRNLGTYVNDHFDLGSRISASVGTRFTSFSAKGQQTYAVGPVVLDASGSGFSGSAGVIFHAIKAVNLVANVIRALRSPNLADLTSASGSSATSVTIPASNAGFEKLTSTELGLKFQTERLLGSAFFFQNRWRDQMTSGPSTYNGLPFFDPDGNGVQEKNEPSIRRPVNIGRSEIHGVELSARFLVSTSVTIDGNLTRTIGDNQLAGTPLRRMPPTYGALTMRWTGSPPRWLPWAELGYRYAFDQTRLAPGDISDARIGPQGTPAYNVFDIRGGLSLTPRLLMSVGVENVTNELYKEHGSWLYRPGRSFNVGTQWRF